MPMNFTYIFQNDTRQGELTFYEDYAACNQQHRQVDADTVIDFVADHNSAFAMRCDSNATETEITLQTDAPDLIDTLSTLGTLIAISRP